MKPSQVHSCVGVSSQTNRSFFGFLLQTRPQFIALPPSLPIAHRSRAPSAITPPGDRQAQGGATLLKALVGGHRWTGKLTHGFSENPEEKSEKSTGFLKGL